MLRKLSYDEINDNRPAPEEALNAPRRPIVVVADNIRSAHNVGALFRTSDGAHIEHLYLCGITCQPPRADIRKASLGAEESVPWSYHEDAAALITELREKGYHIVMLEHTTASVDYREAGYRYPLCLVVGNEYHGIQDHLVPLGDLAVEIPMHGIKQSLNVSVAYGIALYEILAHVPDNL